MKILCQKMIRPEGCDPRYSTYCMRPKGHEQYDPKGKCEINPTERDREQTK